MPLLAWRNSPLKSIWGREVLYAPPTGSGVFYVFNLKRSLLRGDSSFLFTLQRLRLK